MLQASQQGSRSKHQGNGMKEGGEDKGGGRGGHRIEGRGGTGLRGGEAVTWIWGQHCLICLCDMQSDTQKAWDSNARRQHRAINMGH